MKIINLEKENRVIKEDILLNYGFKKENGIYTFKKAILEDFTLSLEINKNKIISRLIDNTTNEDYYLVDIDSASGNYLGSIKEIYEKEINDILNNCTYKNVYNNDLTKAILNYTKEKYEETFEFPFKTNELTSIVRHKENKKWYALLTTIEKDKLGFNETEEVEIINLKNNKEKIDKLIDNKNFIRAYHMNKKYWFTIILDDNISLNEIYTLIDESYNLTK